MANEVEIVVKSSDRSDPGKVRARWKTSMKGVTDDVEKETGRQRDALGRFVKGAGDDGDRAGKSFSDRFRKAVGGENIAGGLLGKLKATLTAGLQPTASAIATGFSAQFVAAVASGLASGAAKVAHGGAAMLALLPAVATAGVLAMGAIKIAVLGVADALEAGLAGDTEKFNEALEGMAPAARNVMRDIVGLKGRLDELKSSVQQAMFAPLVNSVRPLADAYLPTVQTVLSDIARTFGQVGNSVGAFLSLPSTTMSLAGAMGNARDAVVNVVSGVGSLVQAFLPLVTVGSTFLPQLTDGFGGATARLASFMQEAERTGELAGFIQGGLDKLRALWMTGEQVVRILKDVGAIGKMVFAGIGLESGGLLDTIERLVGGLRAFFETSEGSQVLNQILAALGGLASSAMGTLQQVFGMIAPFLPQIVAFATAFNNLKVAILEAVEPAVQVIGGLLLPALTALMEWLANNGPILQGILIALFTLWAIHAGAAAIATIAATWPLIALGVAIAALAALVIVHFGTIKQWVMNVFNWIRDNWPLLLFILLGPFAPAVLFIIHHFDTIKQWALNVINWIRDNWQLLLAILTGPIGIAVFIIASHIDTIRGVISGAVDFISGIVGGISDAFWGVAEQISDAIEWAKDKIGGLVEAIENVPGAGVIRGIAGAFGIGNAHGGIVGAASGGLRSGLHLVGERGAELVNIPTGSRVIPNNEMGRALGGTGGGGGITVNIYPQGSILAERDLVKIINDAILHGDMRDALTRATAGV